jgi:hypothetical protein
MMLLLMNTFHSNKKRMLSHNIVLLTKIQGEVWNQTCREVDGVGNILLQVGN